MRLVCVGGGPAGLVAAIALKRADPRHEVAVYERSSSDAEQGWGVSLDDDVLAALRETDPQIAQQVAAGAAPWTGETLFVRDERADRDGSGYAIGRPQLVRILTDRARALDVEVIFDAPTEIAAVRDDVDVVALCDGMNSGSRAALGDAFGTGVEASANKYVWLGTTAQFEAFTFAFVHTPAGWVWLYAYPYDGAYATCVVECAADTWHALGFEHHDRATAITRLEDIFSAYLATGTLIGRGDDSSELEWRNFQTITNARWHSGNLVLVGDAAHTTHYSIGSGTKLAVADANALAASLTQHPHIPTALNDYEAKRRPETRAAQTSARHSAQFYENIDRYVDLRADLLLTALRARRHGWLRYIPPKSYAQTYAMTQRVPPLRSVRELIRDRARKF